MHKYSRLASLAFLLLNALLFITCSKEEENGLPWVNIILPAENSDYSMHDSVMVRAEVFDDQGIHSVKISIKDEDHIPVYTREMPVNQAKSYKFDHLIDLSDLNLNGSYYIEVRAFDEMEDGASFRYIHIGSGNKKTNALFSFDVHVGGVDVYKHQEENVKIKTLSGDFLESAVDEEKQILYSCGAFTGDLVAMDTSGRVLWSFGNPGLLSVQYFRDLHFHDGLIYTSLYDARILGHDQDGNKVFENSFNQEFFVEKIHRHDDRFVLEKVKKSGGVRYISMVHFPSGQLIHETVFTYGEILDFFSIDENRIIVLSGDEHEYHICEYNASTFSMKELHTASTTEKITALVQVEDNNILFGMGGSLLHFNSLSKTLTNSGSEYSPIQMRYNEHLRSIWLAESNQLIELDENSWIEISRMDLDYELVSLEIFSAY